MNNQKTLLNGTSLTAHRGAMVAAFADGNYLLRPLAFDGEGGGSGAGDAGQGAGGAKIDPNDPVIQALIKNAVEKEVTGLRGNRDELKAEKEKLKAEHEKLLMAVGGEEGLKRLEEQRKKAEQDEEQKLILDGKHDLWLERRTQAMKESQSKELAARDKLIQELTADRDQAIQRLTGYKTTQQLMRCAEEAGVKPEYRDALIALVQGRVALEDENGADVFRVYEPDGKTKSFGPSAKDMTVTELFDTFRDKMKDAFLASRGSGASGGNKSGFAGRNPWDKATFNATEQAQITRTNPTLAAQLKAEAGVK